MPEDLLLKMAERAIEELFCDNSVPLEGTLERLQRIQEDVEERIQLIGWDIENRDG